MKLYAIYRMVLSSVTFGLQEHAIIRR